MNGESSYRSKFSHTLRTHLYCEHFNIEYQQVADPLNPYLSKKLWEQAGRNFELWSGCGENEAGGRGWMGNGLCRVDAGTRGGVRVGTGDEVGDEWEGAHEQVHMSIAVLNKYPDYYNDQSLSLSESMSLLPLVTLVVQMMISLSSKIK